MSATLHHLVASQLGEERTEWLLNGTHIHPALLEPTANRAVTAQALGMLLLDDLLGRVPSAAAYVDDTLARGGRLHLDHGAVRTVSGVDCGELAPGPQSLDPILNALGYRRRETYDLARLQMTGRSWCHLDLPADIPQYFVSELHAERFSEPFQQAAQRILGSSRDPLDDADRATLAALAANGWLTTDQAVALLPALVRCFRRHHEDPELDDYRTVLSVSQEMAWIATEGTVFNHATDRVADVVAIADAERAAGRPIKDTVEVSGSGRIIQTAHRATTVDRNFRTDAGTITLQVPGSFFEFITRLPMPGTDDIDLAFDAANAQQIFAMTRGSPWTR